MNYETVSATFSVEQINELTAMPIHFLELRPQIELIVETETITLDPSHPMFWFAMPERGTDSQLASEFDAWEAASDDDLANFENSL